MRYNCPRYQTHAEQWSLLWEWALLVIAWYFQRFICCLVDRLHVNESMERKQRFVWVFLCVLWSNGRGAVWGSACKVSLGHWATSTMNGTAPEASTAASRRHRSLVSLASLDVTCPTWKTHKIDQNKDVSLSVAVVAQCIARTHQYLPIHWLPSTKFHDKNGRACASVSSLDQFTRPLVSAPTPVHLYCP